MLFIPYRADLQFTHLPWVTIAVCLLCVFVYFQQASSDSDLEPAARAYCAKQHPRRFWLTVEKVTGTRTRDRCAELVEVMHASGRAEAVIPALAAQAAHWDTMGARVSRDYTAAGLTAMDAEFARTVPPTLTARLVFDPAHSSFTRMFTAAVAHAGWDHLIGNLFFFFAFAAMVEIAVGPVVYAALLLELAFGTHLAYALTQIATHRSVPTLGLSGVVSGTIGLFTYLAPQARIRCFAWFLFFWRTYAVPGWILAAWFVGWDVYNLLHDDGASNVNFVAHVSGAFLGYCTGVGFLGGARDRVQSELSSGARPGAARAGPARTPRSSSRGRGSVARPRDPPRPPR